MKPYFQSANVTIFNGDCLEVLRTLPSESVHCCVTSPPYWGLRDYGACSCGSGRYSLGQGDGTGGNLNYRSATNFREDCTQCGGSGRIIGTENQLGLERTPEEYIAKMVAVFAEVKRVLRDDGTLWLNMGDSYAATTKGSGGHNPKQDSNTGSWHSDRKWEIPTGLKPKDLVGIPWMLAFALRADGWYLRSDIIWAKPNPMPESVTDRPTKAHEYIFLLAKSERYYYDADLIAESSIRADQYPGGGIKYSVESAESALGKSHNLDKYGLKPVPDTRNKRSVWEVATQPFPEAHFATFPEELIKPCILAGCPAGGTVLDPFFGGGTTGLVAQTNGCKAIGIELNPAYIEIAKRRLRQEVLEFS